MNDAVATQLRQIVARYGLEVCEDPRRVEALLRDLSGEHRREIAVLAGAAREGVPAELLAAKDTAPAPVLAERLARMLQDNLGLADEAAQWAVATWASALDVTGLSPPVVASGKLQATRSTADPGPEDARTRITRLLGNAEGAAGSITDKSRKERALRRLVEALAATDPDRATPRPVDHDRVLEGGCAVSPRGGAGRHRPGSRGTPRPVDHGRIFVTSAMRS